MSDRGKVVLIQYLREHGLVVEGNEKQAELAEAYKYLRAAGYLSIGAWRTGR